MKHDENIAGVSRDRVYDALIAEESAIYFKELSKSTCANVH